jgi:16S rRNA (guanine527-N7)-methyltransferase
VKHQFDLDKLYHFLDSVQIALTLDQKRQFERFLDLLITWSHKQNLVSRNDLSTLVERHFLPSVFLCSHLPDRFDGKVIDIGSGAGFPGIIIKIIKPVLTVDLLDSSRKKALFLNEASDQLKLDLTIICQRSEVYQQTAPAQYRYIVSRAVASFDKLWRWSSDLLDNRGALYILKGGDFSQETKALGDKAKIRIIQPSQQWQDISDYMAGKCIVVLEK